MQSCCPAEEVRLRRRGRTFGDPEEFRHADELSAPPPASTAVITPQEHFSTSLDDETLSIEPRSETFNRHQQLSGDAFSNTEDGRGVCTASSVKGTLPPPDPQNRPRCDHPTAAVPPNAHLSGSGRSDHQPNTQEGHALGEGQHQVDEKKVREEQEEAEFRPKKAMSARTVVRERRQWALRRSRRLEGPNEANQLELGGGPPVGSGVPEAWVDTVVRVAGRGGVGSEGEGPAREGKEVGVARSGGGAGGDGGTVALLVSCGRLLSCVFRFWKITFVFSVLCLDYTVCEESKKMPASSGPHTLARQVPTAARGCPQTS